jgi:cephalosporin hydroxylase
MDLEKYSTMFDKYWPDQCKTGLRWLVERFTESNPHYYLEIGCGWGGTLAIFTEQMGPKSLSIGVDYMHYKTQWDPILELYNKDDSTKIVHLITGSSILESTITEVRQAIMTDTTQKDLKVIDFLFIDGNHFSPYPLRDFEIYSPFVRSGGIVAFHDYDPGCGVGVDVEIIRSRGHTIHMVPNSKIETAYLRMP